MRKKSFNILIALVLFFHSCNEEKSVSIKNQIENTSIIESENIIEPATTELEYQDIDLTKTIEPFIDKVLNENKRKHEIEKLRSHHLI